jgi:ABC-type antimicrobial peptide transport system permease subunit
VAVLSHDFFVRRLDGDRDALGRPLFLNGHAFTPIGITPPGFRGYDVGGSPDIWIPMMLEPGLQARLMPALRLLDQSNGSLTPVVARLRPGVTRERAEAAAELALQQGWPHLGARGQDAPRVRLTAGGRGLLQVPGWIERYLTITFGGTAVLLAIACVNVASLLLARASARQREMGVRVALGASHGRVVRQMLTESLVIAAMGCGLGLLAAYWAAAGLSALLPQGSLPMVLETRLDTRILAFTAGLSMLTALLFGLAPALQVLRG